MPDSPPPIPLPEAPPPRDTLSMRHRSRGWFIAAVVLLAIESVAAFVGDKMFRFKSRAATSSKLAVDS